MGSLRAAGGYGDWFLGPGTDATLRHAGGHGAAIGVISLGTGDIFLSAVHGWTFTSGSWLHRADAILRHAGHHGASIRVISLRTGDVFLSAVCRWAASRQRGGHGDWFLGLGTDTTLRHAGGHGAAIGVISLGTGDVFLSAVRGWTFVCQAAGTEEENCKRWPHSDF